MDIDFPAAHSMDTKWFAVDRDGQVAVFDAGQIGAVPTWCADEHDVDVDEIVMAQFSAAHAASRLTPVFHPVAWRYSDGSYRHYANGHLDYPVKHLLMFLDCSDEVAESISAGSAREVDTDEGVGVLWSEIQVEEFDRLHAGGVCRGCDWYFGDLALLSHAFYVYDSVGEGDRWDAVRYRKVSSPSTVLDPSGLSKELKDLLKRARFWQFSFAETPELQPIFHLRCKTWGQKTRKGWDE